MMSPEALSFVGSLVVGILSLVGIIYSTNSTRKVYEAVNDQKLKVIEGKIETLTKEQQKHNNLVERTYKLESDFATRDKDFELVNHEISGIKTEINEIQNNMESVKETIHSIQIAETQMAGQIDKNITSLR